MLQKMLENKMTKKQANAAEPIAVPYNFGTGYIDSSWHRLLTILSFGRPYGSMTNELFKVWLTKQFPNFVSWKEYQDYIVADIGTNFKTAFIAHIDTVHKDEGHQDLLIDDVELSTGNGSCLGADDGAGVWLLLEMMHAGVEGRYIFFDGEECGCIGSGHFAYEPGTLLDGIEHAISFDRQGETSIVTHQMGRRTASDAFANELAAELGMEHKPDAGGVYTDSEQLAALVSECTNVSVGYHNQHRSSEILLVDYLYELRDALVRVNWHLLPAEREPVEDTYGLYATQPFLPESYYRGKTVGDLYDEEFDYMYDLVLSNPEEAAILLMERGVTEDDFIRVYGGGSH